MSKTDSSRTRPASSAPERRRRSVCSLFSKPFVCRRPWRQIHESSTLDEKEFSTMCLKALRSELHRDIALAFESCETQDDILKATEFSEIRIAMFRISILSLFGMNLTDDLIDQKPESPSLFSQANAAIDSVSAATADWVSDLLPTYRS